MALTWGCPRRSCGTLFSAMLTAFWFLVMKPRMVDKTRAGMSREALLGETGQVILAQTKQQEAGGGGGGGGACTLIPKASNS